MKTKEIKIENLSGNTFVAKMGKQIIGHIEAMQKGFIVTYIFGKQRSKFNSLEDATNSIKKTVLSFIKNVTV